MTKITQDRVVSVARGLFRSRGYEGASIGDIAAALGLRKASLYSRVESKAELARAAVALTRAELELPPAQGNWREAYTEAMRHLADYLAGSRRCIGLHLLYDERLEETVRAEVDLFFETLEAALTGLAEDALGPERARHLAEEALCALEGGTLWLALRNDRAPLDRTVARFCADLPES